MSLSWLVFGKWVYMFLKRPRNGLVDFQRPILIEENGTIQGLKTWYIASEVKFWRTFLTQSLSEGHWVIGSLNDASRNGIFLVPRAFGSCQMILSMLETSGIGEACSWAQWLHSTFLKAKVRPLCCHGRLYHLEKHMPLAVVKRIDAAPNWTSPGIDWGYCTEISV